MKDIFEFADELGPEKIIHIHLPATGLKAVVAVDNTALGPAIGGVRMALDVTAEEAFRLARSMTLKNAAAGIPHGGGKSVIYGDPMMPVDKKEKLIRAFACSIRGITDYIPGPDMGTDEQCMAWIKDEIGRAAGLPAEIGGIPLDEIGATGFGLFVSGEVAQEFCDVNLNGAKVVVQGFGSVGMHASRFLAQKGAVLVAAADFKGTTFNPNGIDVESLIAFKKTGKSVADFPEGERLERDMIIEIECDIWIPAARPDVINKENVDKLKTKLILPGANIPITPEAEDILHKKNVLVVPDFIVNAGGVICCAVEYRGGTQDQAFQVIREKISKNTRLVLEEAKRTGKLPRQAAIDFAKRRVLTAARYRRYS